MTLFHVKQPYLNKSVAPELYVTRMRNQQKNVVTGNVETPKLCEVFYLNIDDPVFKQYSAVWESFKFLYFSLFQKGVDNKRVD